MEKSFIETVILFAVLPIFGCSGSVSNIGLIKGNLKLCPSSPNCVSTTAQDEEHGIKPFLYSGERSETIKKVIKVLKKNSSCKIITIEGNYIHAVYTSKIFRFKDDVEFLFPEVEKIVHFRSTSRIGYSDLDANRKRMEKFRKDFSFLNNDH